MQLPATIIRIAVDAAKRGQPLIDLNTGQIPQIFAGTDVQIQLGLFNNGTLLDASGLSQLQLDLKTQSAPLGASALTLALTSGGINTSCTSNQWIAGTSQHAVFSLTNSQTNFPLTGPQTFQLLLSGQTSGSPGTQLVYGLGPFSVVPTGLNAGGSPPSSSPTWYTAAASDARYLVLGGSGQTVANVTAFSSGLTLGSLSLPASGQALSLAGLVGGANGNAVTVAPYLGFTTAETQMPASGAANFGPSAGQTSMETVDTTHYHRVRQNGTLTGCSFYLPATIGITGFYIKIWRANSAGTYDLVGVSEEFHAFLAAGTVNRVFSTPITAVQEGDFIGFRAEFSGGATAQNFYAWPSVSGYSPTSSYSALSVSPLIGSYNWSGQTSNNAAMPLLATMSAPFFVAIGDSLMSGAPAHFGFADTYATPATSLPDSMPWYLGRALGVTYQNMAHAGYSAFQISLLVSAEVVPLHPRFCFIDGGNNDLFASLTAAAIEGYWAATLGVLQTAGITPVVLLIPPFRNYSLGSTALSGEADTINAWLVSQAANYGAIIVDPRPHVGLATNDGPAGNYWALQAQYDSGDGLHLNSAGYAKISQIAAQAVCGLTIGGRLITGPQLLFGNMLMDPQSPRMIEIPRQINYEAAGQNLTIRAGGAYPGGANLAGGQLILSSGVSTGTGIGSISLQTATGGSSGMADSLPTQRALVQQGGGYSQCNLYGDSGNGAEFALYVNGGTASIALFAPSSGTPGLASASSNPQPIVGIDAGDNVMVEYTLTAGARTAAGIANCPIVATSGGLTYAAIQSTGSHDAQLIFYNGATYKGGIGWQQSSGKIGLYCGSGAGSPVATIDSSGNLSALGAMTAVSGVITSSAAGALAIGGTTYATESTLYVQSAGASYTSGANAIAKFMAGAHGTYIGYDTTHTCGVVGANTEGVSNDNLALAPNGGFVLVGGIFSPLSGTGFSTAALQVNGIMAANNGAYIGNTLNVTANGANITGAVAITGVLTMSAVPKFGGTNTTGSGAAGLGSNCPAATAAGPYTWIEATAADGSPVYFPVWK